MDLTAGARKTNTTRRATILKQFSARSPSFTWMSAAVMMEPRSGARTPGQVAVPGSGLLEPFIRRERLLGPTSRAFPEAGQVMAVLANPARDSRQHLPASFVADILLASRVERPARIAGHPDHPVRILCARDSFRSQ